MKLFMKKILQSFLERLGYQLVSTRQYLDVEPLIANADKENKTICDYLEDKKSKDPECSTIKGRRDRIVNKLSEYDISGNVSSILEIGPGTGNFTEIFSQNHNDYEIYEMHSGWANYLEGEYDVIIRNCDGSSLKDTVDNSIDLVHAHAVFVYIPILTVYDYLEEISRVLKPGGKVVFNIFTERTFTYDYARKWKNSEHRFPVIIPERMILEFTEKLNFSLVGQFDEIYGPGCIAEYFILQYSHS